MRLTALDIANAAGGVVYRGSLDTIVSGISTDTRKIRAGEFFCALDGPRNRGADFISAAIEAGAAGIITHDSEAEYSDAATVVRVPDTLRAYGDIANLWRNQVAPRVIALSGSSGKTTTKEMLAHIIRGAVPSLATEGNKNNLVGLPMTLNRLEETHQVAVVELGMNHPGELQRLTEICDPDIALITNIGNAHIGNFGGLDALIRGEAEIICAMRQNATLLLNSSCPNFMRLQERYHFTGRTITFGRDENAEVRVSEIETLPGTGYRFKITTATAEAKFEIPMFGRFNIDNACAASAAALVLGLDIELIAERLRSFAGGMMRSEVEHFDGITILKDCYNASPDAMLRSIESIGDFPRNRRKIAMIGDMLELGEHAQHYHREAGLAIGAAKFDLLCAVGEWTPLVIEEAARLGVRCEHFPDARAAAHFLAVELKNDDVLLVKGSRGNRLEVVLDSFRTDRTAIRNGETIPGFVPGAESTCSS